MTFIKDTRHAAEYFIDTVRSGKTIYGRTATARQVDYFTSGTYTARVFDVWVETPLGIHAQQPTFLFFKRKLYESFGREHGFKSEPVGMSVSLIPLQEIARRKGYAVVVMENGDIYDKPACEWMGWCNEYANREVIRTMRAQNNGEHLEASNGGHYGISTYRDIRH